jgi:23S rRNA pseudouridine2605 synthase
VSDSRHGSADESGPDKGPRSADRRTSTGRAPAGRSEGGQGAAKRPAGNRDGQRPSGNRDAKKPYGDRDAKKPYGDRDAKKPYGDRDAKRPYGDRDAKKPYGDRDAKRPYGDRDAKRPYGDRDAKKPYGDARKPYGDRDAKKPYGDRDAKKPYGDARKPYGDRDAKKPYGDRGAKKPYDDRDERPATHGAPSLAVRPRHDDPEIPERIEARDLDKSARGELRTLSKENADWVARHLVAASEYLEDDPELAHEHAMSAARRAGRIGVVRETLAITAYATGDFALALRELRTYRRISGSNEQLPLMVDSERGVGRPDRALEVGRAVDRAELPPTVQVGLAIAMSGARLDLGQPELALAELEIPQLDPDRAFSYSPALFSAYAEVLEELGRDAEAAEWRSRAARAEAALGGPAESEVVEIFDVGVDGDEPETHAGAAAESDHPSADAAQSTEAVDDESTAETVADASDDLIDDPGAVLEDDVAAVLAEGASLEAEAAAAEMEEVGSESAVTEEATPDGAVPHED